VSNKDHSVRVKPSIFDRLLDFEPEKSSDQTPSRAESVRRYKASVQRDLEELLNARSTGNLLPADYAQIRRSVLAYGLPDISSLNVSSSSDRSLLRDVIEVAIRVFEPRLRAVSVILAPREPNERTLRFRVDAKLILDPEPEPISFNMVMQLNNQQYEVKTLD
jgi:type VI secretion system protein ImpF